MSRPRCSACRGDRRGARRSRCLPPAPASRPASPTRPRPPTTLDAARRRAAASRWTRRARRSRSRTPAPAPLGADLDPAVGQRRARLPRAARGADRRGRRRARRRPRASAAPRSRSSSTRRSRPARAAASRFDVDIRVPRARATASAAAARPSRCSPTRSPRSRTSRAARWRLDRYFAVGEAWTYPAADWRVRLRRAARRRASPRRACASPTAARLLEHGRDYSFAAGPAALARRATVGGVAVTVWGAARPRRSAELRARAARSRASGCRGSRRCSAPTAGRTCRSSSPTPPRWSTPR